MLSRISLLTGGCILLAFTFGAAADDKKAADDPTELKITLQLKTIEAAKLTAHYEMLVEREIGLQGSVQACMKAGDNRLQQYQSALQDTQNELDATKKKLMAMEAKLKKRLDAKDGKNAAPEPTEKMNRTLEKILERLESIEKRLEKIEKRRL